MESRWPRVLLTGLAALWLASCGAKQRDLLVFAAAVMGDVMVEIGEGFERRHATPVSYNFASSNMLAEQILYGAPANVYLSANEAQIRHLDERGKIRMEAAIPLLSNSLVVVVAESSEVRSLSDPSELTAFSRFAIADPIAAPVGVYARQWLEHEGLWSEIAPRVVGQLDSRATLGAVISGNLPVGVVYFTDAASSKRVRIAYRVPPERMPAIRFFATTVPDNPHPDATVFLAHLQTAEAKRVFERHGFRFLPETTE